MCTARSTGAVFSNARTTRSPSVGLTVAALLEMLSPHYAFAAQVPQEDARISSSYLKYPSPEGSGEMRGLFAKPAAVQYPDDCSGHCRRA